MPEEQNNAPLLIAGQVVGYQAWMLAKQMNQALCSTDIKQEAALSQVHLLALAVQTGLNARASQPTLADEIRTLERSSDELADKISALKRKYRNAND